jgi:hypothetical protein
MKREGNENSETAEKNESKRAVFERTESQAFCLICNKQVGLLTFEHSAEILKTDLNEILEFAESGQIHRLHNALGKVEICAESLFDVLETRPTERLNPDIFKTNPSSSNILF